jgi:hypothetical protein
LGGLGGTAKKDYELGELGDLEYIVGDVEKGSKREHVFHIEDDVFLGGFVHIGKAFVHDEQIKVLQEIACKISPVLLSQRESSETGAQVRGKAEQTGQGMKLLLVGRRGYFLQVFTYAAPGGKSFQVIGIKDGPFAGHHLARRGFHLPGYNLG